MKKAWQNFIRIFQPTYSVAVTTYFVVPGYPLNRNHYRHDFDKGAYEEAKRFFDRVAKKTHDLRFAPVEIDLVKGKKTIMEKIKFGPVEQIKKIP